MMVAEIKQALVGSLQEIMPMFGMNLEYVGETAEERLESASQVNILIGLSMSVAGNVILGFSRENALRIVSGMMGGMEVTALDPMAKSALGELANMVIGSSMAKVSTPEKLIDLSPPTLVTGEKIFIMISKVQSWKLTFKFNDEFYYVIFSLE